ncbi:PspA domain-containing protein [Gordonia hankookensis]|uniref:PspA domain-containing protein n=1 Tax=Gordonia hankookensis TaxID=589403 RepID=A0ABR7W5W6_9ACTN|nr:PspA domain-containing protein [Gordonia hankookensis]MBD1317970.1 PspA domain-containing protein [Gordonia hankookensis]
MTSPDDASSADQHHRAGSSPDDPEASATSADVVDAEIVSPTGTPVPFPPLPDPDYTDQGVPTFDFVRDKIENRVTTAIGSEELAEASPEGQQVDEMMRKRDEAAKKKLDEIRKSMGKG